MGVLLPLILELYRKFNSTKSPLALSLNALVSTSKIWQQSPWASCKQLYFVFIVIGNLKSERAAFIHAPSFSFNEVKRILESGILAYRIP
jgi:hypothetical protein